MLVGKIDDVGGKHVSTEFIFFIGPLFPKCSWYVTGENYERSAGRSTYSWQGRRIKLQWASVLLGYARVWPAWLALAMPFILMWGESVDFSRPEMLISLGLLIFWIVMLIVPGLFGRTQRAQLKVLGQASALYLDPKRLPEFDRGFAKQDLSKELDLADVHLDTPTVALDNLETLDEQSLGVLYTYARYAAVDEPAWQATAEKVWARIQAQR